MKHIVKFGEPQEFLTWKRQNSPQSYFDLTDTIRRMVRSSLIKEQNGICCYCGVEIKLDSSHIDHFEPRAVGRRTSQLDYNNMHASCEGINNSDENCGKKKKQWFDRSKMISPLDPQCEDNFTYTINGEIQPAGDNQSAQEMISRLGLNCYALQQARRAAIKTTGILERDFGAENKTEWLSVLSECDESGQSLSFCMAVRYCLERLG